MDWKRVRMLLLIGVFLKLAALGLFHVVINPPTFDFVVLCEYSDGYRVNVHRGICSPERELVSWKVFPRKSDRESTWQAYLAPYSAGSPYYGFHDYGDDSHLEHLVKEAVSYITYQK